MSDPIPLSQAAYDRIKAEHEHLTTTWRLEIARKIETARELGDLSENGDYHAAKEEQGQTEGRIAHLANVLENAVIVESASTDTVSAGCVVEIRYEGDPDTQRYLLGSIEEKVEGIDVMSLGSPLGQALMGRSPGDTVALEGPGGRALNVEIVSIGD